MAWYLFYRKLLALILRQTISDIDKNYGSAKSYYTSQPNDYLGKSNSEGFNYFTKLIDIADSQYLGSKFAVMG